MSALSTPQHPLVGTYGWAIGSDVERLLGAGTVLRVDEVVSDYRVKGTTSQGRAFMCSIGQWMREVTPATEVDFLASEARWAAAAAGAGSLPSSGSPGSPGLQGLS